MTNIFGISGKAGSGKNTVGDILQYLIWTNGDINLQQFEEFQSLTFQKETWSGWEQKAFAKVLKEIVALYSGIKTIELEKQEVKNSFANSVLHSFTYRTLLTKTGDALATIHPDIFVNALFLNYNINSHKWIITDVRHPNELEAVKSRGGLSIRVDRYCYDSAEDFLVCHPEKEIRKIGFDIDRNEQSSMIDFEEPARLHGYVPLHEQHSSETSLDNHNFDYVIDNNGSILDLILKVKDVLIKEGHLNIKA